MSFEELQTILSAHITSLGFSRWGTCALSPSTSIGRYRAWLENKYHGDMEYLQQHAIFKEKPHLKFPQMKSAIVFAHPYLNSEASPFPNLKIASYAQLPDYHFWLKEKLDQLIIELKKNYSANNFLAVTDSTPLLERELAYRSGLGWFGKNTCIIHREGGSFFLIGEILTDLEFPDQTPSPDHCGTCNACVEACPTQALNQNKELDARKCISFLTIESKSVPEESLRKSIQNLLFGCDICQQVCPWNQKNLKLFKIDHEPPREEQVKELKEILESSSGNLERKLKNSPILRARPWGLKRNAMIVAANCKFHELKPQIQKFSTDPRLGELAAWALKEIDIN